MSRIICEKMARLRKKPVSLEKPTGNAVIQVLQHLTHMDKDKFSMPPALGIRESSLKLAIKVKSEKGGNKSASSFRSKNNKMPNISSALKRTAQ